MAQRFGGKYSPDTPPQPSGTIPPERRPRIEHRQEGWPFWIVAAALPFLPMAFGDGPVALARGLAAFALIATSAWMTREGLRAEAAFEARKVARRPALPRKLLGAVLLGLGLACGAQSPEMGLAGAAVIGLIGLGLGVVTFGFDPAHDKGMEGIDTFQQDRVARVVEEGEKYLAAMQGAIARAGDRQLEARVAQFATTAQALFRAVEEDPGDLSAARRYMGVYLEGARDATVKFADLWAQTRDAQARADYAALLDDLESNFTARTRSLIENGREGLEIEIDVLRDRLAREGVRPPGKG